MNDERTKTQIIVWILLLSIFLLVASFLVYIRYEQLYFLGFVTGILYTLLVMIISVGITLDLIPDSDC